LKRERGGKKNALKEHIGIQNPPLQASLEAKDRLQIQKIMNVPSGS